MKQRLGLGILLGLAMLLMVPAVSSAQSAIVGLLTDDSGGVLPGVTVEVASPVMIEGSKTTVTDSQGRYRFEAMRPGVYKTLVLAHRLRHGRPRGRGPAIELHGHGQRRDEGRLARRDDQRIRHGFAGRRAAGDAHDGHRARRHRLAADFAQRHGAGGDRSRRAAQHSRYGRRADDRAGRPSRPRARRPGRRPARRRHVDPELRGDVAELPRRHAAVGDDGQHGRDSGGHGWRRHSPEQHSQGRRQPVQRLGVHGRNQGHVGQRTTSTTGCARAA